MRLLIFTTKKDESARLLKKESNRDSLECQVFYYSEMTYQDGHILYHDRPVKIQEKDKIILRSPYHPLFTKRRYSFLADKLLSDHPEKVLLDKDCFENFPNYEDKLYQAELFNQNGIKTPPTFFGAEYESVIFFPAMAKRRLCARCRGNSIIHSQKRLAEFFKNRNPLDYIIQPYIPVKKDFRIYILRDKISAIVDRRIIDKKNGKMRVKFSKIVKSLPAPVINQAKKIHAKIKADLSGVDVVLSEDNQYFFLEINISPQFSPLLSISDINLAKEIIKIAKSS
jgi:hypothetical protein